MQTLLLIAQEIDLSKWGSPLVAIVGALVTLGITLQKLNAVVSRIESVDKKVDSLSERTHTLHLEITTTKTQLAERTDRANGTGRHPAVMP
jgi:hypothetical protein